MKNHKMMGPPKGYKEAKVDKPQVRNFGGERLTVHGLVPPEQTDEVYPMWERDVKEGSIDNDDRRKNDNRSKHGSYRR